MLKLLNTKMLIAILAALAAIASAAIYQRHEARKGRCRAILRLSNSRRMPSNGSRKTRRSARRSKQDKKRHNSAAGNEGKTWKSYIP